MLSHCRVFALTVYGSGKGLKMVKRGHIRMGWTLFRSILSMTTLFGYLQNYRRFFQGFLGKIHGCPQYSLGTDKRLKRDFGSLI